MRVLHVITGLGIGGAERMLQKLLGSAALANFEQHVIALLPHGALTDSMKATGAHVVELNLLGGVPILGGAGQLAFLSRRLSPDIVHGWLYHGNLGAWIVRAVQSRRIPLIWGMRQSLASLEGENPWARAAIYAGRLMSRVPDCLLFNSRTSLDQHRRFGFHSSRMRVLPNGFDLERFRPDQEARARQRRLMNIADDQVVFGLVARVHPAKDHGCFLRAAREVAQRRANATFVLCGSEADERNAALSRMIMDAGLAGRVRRLGVADRVHEVIAALDVLVSSSMAVEAFSNSVGEAMSCGVPCVVTDVGDSPTVIGDTGWVVPPRDPGRLAEAMIRMIDVGPTIRHDMGLRARARVESEYGLESVAARHGELWNELAEAA